MPKEPTAADVMTDGVIAIEHDASVVEAAQKMREENIRSLVVVDDGEAVGIVVGRDILYSIVAEGRDADGIAVGEVMTDNLVTASESDSIEEIARAMVRNDISRVPVLRDDTLVGMVTQSNLVRAWPSYLDLLEEETHLMAGENDGAIEEPETRSGICDSCGNYSEELVDVDGELLCPECLEGGLR